MNPFRQFETVIREAITRIPALANCDPALLDRVNAEPPRDPAHGHIATNAALVLSRAAGSRPLDLAAELRDQLVGTGAIVSAEIAGPGFVNLRLSDDYWRQRLCDILQQGKAYGSSEIGCGRKVNVEYVSANPTGPLHAAHARGAVVGDVLARLLEKAGYEVCREYYINDAGTQVDILARSTYLRYREALGEAPGPIPEGHYPGAYLKDVGRALAERDGDCWRDCPESEWLPAIRTFAIDAMMDGIRTDLQRLGVEMHAYISERRLVESGGVDAVMQTLEEQSLLYHGVLEPPKGKKPDDWEPRPQTLFRATRFGDDVDRAVRKSDGSWTYFASDIAYHLDKYRRGYADMIDVWGADHSGYVKRLQSAVQAITGGKGALDVKICQLVHMKQDGQPVLMSKRTGNFVMLADVIDAVGRDVIRFIMLTRRNDQPLDFDFARVTAQSRDNPVFYVQYAHARCHSVLRHAGILCPDSGPDAVSLSQNDLSRLADPAELDLIRQLANWPRIVESAAVAHEPHRVAFYLSQVAAEFHALWNMGRDDTTLRFIVENDPELTRARLVLVSAVATVIASGLAVMGITPVEELRS